MLTQEQGNALVVLARAAIAEKLGIRPERRPDEDLLAAPEMQEKHGTFVTLTMGKALRGCIGSLQEAEPLAASVERNAISAAFHDSRFSPLSRNEYPEITVEVSVLTEPQPLEYVGSDDLTGKLRPGVDGVILRRGRAGATFLPQVWDQLPQPAQFLTHLCMKAGLPADAWQTMDLEVCVYQVQKFSEKEARVRPS